MISRIEEVTSEQSRAGNQTPLATSPHDHSTSGAIRCMRCNGKMTPERFYGYGDFFLGARCLRCGDILDPVILLHRVSRNAQISIPEGVEAIMRLVKQYSEGVAIPVQRQRKRKRTRRGLTKNLSRDPVHKSFT